MVTVFAMISHVAETDGTENVRGNNNIGGTCETQPDFQRDWHI